MHKALVKGGALSALLLALSAPALASEALFQQHCATCHGTSAEGIPGLAPPLKHAALWQGLGTHANAYITGVMGSGLSGQLSAMGQMYFGLVMPPQQIQPAADLASVANYVLGLNGVAGTVTQADVSAARATPQGHAALRALRPKNL